MAKHRLLTGFLLVSLLGGGLALAQDQDEQGGSDGDTDDGGGAGAGGGAEMDVQRIATLTAVQQSQEANAMVTRAAEVARRVYQLLGEARRNGEIMLVTCLNDKYTQINAAARSLDDRLDALNAAAPLADRSVRDHIFTVMTVLNRNVSVLEQEANQCLGENIYETGETSIETSVDPEAPEEDPFELPYMPRPPRFYIPPPMTEMS